MNTASRCYSDELARGYVIASLHQGRHGYAIRAWHYGPDHGWGTTFGSLDHCVVVWPSRKAAQQVADAIPTGKRNYRVETLTQARHHARTQLDRAARLRYANHTEEVR